MVLAFVTIVSLALGVFSTSVTIYLLFFVLPKLRQERSKPEFSAQILPRVLPSHVRDGEILVNGTKVQFDDNKELRPAHIGGYHREPGRGNYYLVTYPTRGKVPGRKWVPDTYVWEPDEVREVA